MPRLPLRASLSALCALILLAAGCNDAVLPDAPLDLSEVPPDFAPYCGDGLCSAGETCGTCSADCGLCMGCGDGVCGAGETCQSCPQDCFVCPNCGNGFCDQGETCANCAPDCGLCLGCGNTRCDPPKEDCFTCADDCGMCMGCGDGKCLAPETCASCPGDCGVCTVCGNMKCEGPYETCVNCQGDCGKCAAVGCFEMLTCALPCIGFNTNPPKIGLSCVADCVAKGCPDARFFFDQVFNCFIGKIQKCGPDFGCLQAECGAEMKACIGSKC